MAKINAHINNLFKDVRVIPVRDRAQGDAVFEAYGRAVRDLGYGEGETFGVHEIPETGIKKGRK
jgi:hypothetical protein